MSCFECSTNNFPQSSLDTRFLAQLASAVKVDGVKIHEYDLEEYNGSYPFMFSRTLRHDSNGLPYRDGTLRMVEALMCPTTKSFEELREHQTGGSLAGIADMGNSNPWGRVSSDNVNSHLSCDNLPVQSKQFAYELALMHAGAYLRDCSFNRFEDPTSSCYSKVGIALDLLNNFYNDTTRQNLFRSPYNNRNQFVSLFFIYGYTSSTNNNVGRRYGHLRDPSILHTRSGFLRHIRGEQPVYAQWKEGHSYIDTPRGLASYVAQDLNGEVMTQVLYSLYSAYRQQFGRDPFFRWADGVRLITTAGFDELVSDITTVGLMGMEIGFQEKYLKYMRQRPDQIMFYIDKLLQGGLQGFPHADELKSQWSNASLEILLQMKSDTGSESNYLLNVLQQSPNHPTCPANHAISAAAIVTVLKGKLDLSDEFNNDYTMINTLKVAEGAQQLELSNDDSTTYIEELNKAAYNVAVGRMFAGIHLMRDLDAGMLLGEKIGMEYLRLQACRSAIRSPSVEFTVKLFDGTYETIHCDRDEPVGPSPPDSYSSPPPPTAPSSPVALSPMSYNPPPPPAPLFGNHRYFGPNDIAGSKANFRRLLHKPLLSLTFLNDAHIATVCTIKFRQRQMAYADSTMKTAKVTVQGFPVGYSERLNGVSCTFTETVNKIDYYDCTGGDTSSNSLRCRPGTRSCAKISSEFHVDFGEPLADGSSPTLLTRLNVNPDRLGRYGTGAPAVIDLCGAFNVSYISVTALTFVVVDIHQYRKEEFELFAQSGGRRLQGGSDWDVDKTASWDAYVLDGAWNVGLDFLSFHTADDSLVENFLLESDDYIIHSNCHDGRIVENHPINAFRNPYHLRTKPVEANLAATSPGFVEDPVYEYAWDWCGAVTLAGGTPSLYMDETEPTLKFTSLNPNDAHENAVERFKLLSEKPMIELNIITDESRNSRAIQADKICFVQRQMAYGDASIKTAKVAIRNSNLVNNALVLDEYTVEFGPPSLNGSTGTLLTDLSEDAYGRKGSPDPVCLNLNPSAISQSVETFRFSVEDIHPYSPPLAVPSYYAAYVRNNSWNVGLVNISFYKDNVLVPDYMKYDAFGYPLFDIKSSGHYKTDPFLPSNPFRNAYDPRYIANGPLYSWCFNGIDVLNGFTQIWLATDIIWLNRTFVEVPIGEPEG